MNREKKRRNKGIEKNPVYELNKIQNTFYPSLFEKFKETTDIRHQSYIKYANNTMLGSLYYKNIAGIVTMREMDEKFNDADISKNIRGFCGVEEGKYLPSSVSINEYLTRVNFGELQEVVQESIHCAIRRKSFYKNRFMGLWLVAIDATQLYSGSRQINKECLERHHNKGTENETVNYYNSVLDAKIILGDNVVVSMQSEFIENNAVDTEEQRLMSKENIKQDCEIKAFKRLAVKLKENFKRLPICLLLDSLYACEPVIEICEEYGWSYIIRFKDGSIPSIAQEYEAIPEKTTIEQCEFINEIDYNGHKLNMLKYKEVKIENNKEITTRFQWITNIKITKKNAKKIAEAGRKRWKIENQGFNRQKNWQHNITHMCSWNANAQKCHYLMLQIADFFKQLYELFYLEKNVILKKQKDILFDLLCSFRMTVIVEKTGLEVGTQDLIFI